LEQKRFSNIILENRNRLSLSGVKEVTNFDDETIILNTDLGTLVIKGENLKISSFENSCGELSATGKIIALVYKEENGKENFLKKVFR